MKTEKEESVDWKKEFDKLYAAFDKGSLQDAALCHVSSFEAAVASRRDSKIGWKIATQSLSTLVEWRAKYHQTHETKYSLTFREFFLAYLRDTILNRVALLAEQGRVFPKNIHAKVVEFLISLSEMMTKEGLKAIPLSSYEQNPKDNWRNNFFGDPWSGANKEGLLQLKMIRDCASDFIKFEDNAWKFEEDMFIGIINSIFVVEMTQISSYFRVSGKSFSEARNASFAKFAEALFHNPIGPMCFYDREWQKEEPVSKQASKSLS